MLETILGVLVGAAVSALVSWIIADLYHRRSSKDFQEQIDSLSSYIFLLEEYLSEAKGTLSDVRSDAAMARKHAVLGTPDDPEYPYK